MKIKRYRLRKKYRILLKKYAKLFFVVLLLLGVFHLGKVMYRNLFDKDENQEIAKIQEETKNDTPEKEKEPTIDVIIDAGHGGRDPGCEWDIITEKHITLDISRQVTKKLESLGYTVYMTRTEDADFAEIEDHDLIERVKIGEQIKPKLFVSIHVNFSEYEDPTGCETFYNSEKQFAAKAAQSIASSMDVSGILPSRGASETKPYSPIYIVDYNSCESVLIETAFLSNPNDRQILCTPFKRVEIANVIAQGIHESLNTTSKTE
jgi:N-acetylmuramoyl-L-alanine amidase